MAEEAFNSIDLSPLLIQQQLKDVFLDGIRDDNIARKIIRQKPVTLEAALQIAVQEQLTSRTFDLRRREEPMEVDLVDKTSSGTPHTESEVKNLLNEVLAVMKPPQSKQVNGPPSYKGKPMKWTPDGKPICAYCSKIGHRWKQCFQRKKVEHKRQEN